jgi:hypothetical protein
MSFDNLCAQVPTLEFNRPPDATASEFEIAQIKATLQNFLKQLHATTLNHAGYPQNFSGSVIPEAFNNYTIINIGTAANNPYTSPNSHMFEEDALRMMDDFFGSPLGKPRWGHIE